VYGGSGFRSRKSNQLSQLQNWVGAVNYWVLRADF
jgi:hypothetical protein